MIIKKLVVGSMFSMLLASEMATADWGDVYYCQMTNFISITLEGKQTNYNPQKFQFKLDQTKNAMVFGSTGYFTNSVSKLVKGSNWPSLEKWYANDTYSSIYFDDGKLLYTFNNVVEATASSADCDKF